MDIGLYLLTLVSAGSALAAKGVLEEIGKGSGKAIFEKIKSRLEKSHEILVSEDVHGDQPATMELGRQLSAPTVVADESLIQLFREFQELVTQLPKPQSDLYAIDIETIRAGGSVLFEAIEGGIVGKELNAQGDVTFRDVSARGQKKTSD